MGKKSMQWSAEKPNQAGWWWMDIAGARYVVQVMTPNGAILICCPWWDPAKLSEFEGADVRWAGPLSPPRQEKACG